MAGIYGLLSQLFMAGELQCNKNSMMYMATPYSVWIASARYKCLPELNAVYGKFHVIINLSQKTFKVDKKKQGRVLLWTKGLVIMTRFHNKAFWFYRYQIYWIRFYVKIQTCIEHELLQFSMIDYCHSRAPVLCIVWHSYGQLSLQRCSTICICSNSRNCTFQCRCIEI